MNLPEGVSYRAKETTLCGHGVGCLIRVPPGYDHTQVSLETALVPYLNGDWHDWAALHPCILGRGGPQAAPSYAAAWNRSFRIEVVPEICPGDPDPVLCGARVDRFPAKAPTSPIDRLCEFQTFGMAVIDMGNGLLDLWLAEPGDKLLIPARAYCALYCAGETLITLELANDGPVPEPDHEWRNCLSQSGPPLLLYYDRDQAHFLLNRLCVNSRAHRFGVRLPAKPGPEARSVRVPRSGRMALAPFLHRELTTNLDLVMRFRSLGLRLRHATSEAILPEDPLRAQDFPTPIHYSGRLKDEPESGSLARSYLFGDRIAVKPTPSWRHGFEKKLKARLHAASRLVDQRPDRRRPFNIVIEGVGQWAEKVYRPAARDIAQHATRRFNIFYANDETWAAAPAWRSSLRSRGSKEMPWLSEHYWNKADPVDFRQYEHLREVDAVFIVTPDVTHVEIAKHWLGKTPVIFVEKPFDTEAERFRGLLYSMALSEVEGAYKTAVVGIDHYLLRLSPLLRYFGPILTALGDGLEDVAFEMTEKNPVEPERERTLSLGLGMDLLPHFAALLVLLGPLNDVDLVRVLCAIQYDPLDCSQFDNETGLAGRCRIRDYGSGFLGASFCAGKGIDPSFKSLRVKGRNQNELLIDFAGNTVKCPGVNFSEPILERDVAYRALMSDLYGGLNTILSSCLNVADGEQVVGFLDAMWRSTQWIKQNRNFDRVPRGTGVCDCVSGASL
ncbi:Gfo/Idh/MocA family oxidoreductase [Paludibaculum fermentans]|uniref:Gfo/Idh/MocA family oxidoreductase n=1 Tax=Paludibaculum fermentans TaxID=1473598 RepID=UPI003EB8950B